MPDFAFEDALRAEGAGLVAGLDEAGRGPWAGPVVAAAAVLDPRCLPVALRDGLDDSKALPRRRREELFLLMRESPAVHVAVGIATVQEIDRLNILRASLLAMTRALAALPVVPDAALVDGNRPPDLPCPCRCVVGGDGLALSIAAASVVAKVTRDRMMADLDADHPGYGWARNAGYGTAEHRRALEALGVTPHHRRSFAPILNILRAGESRTPISGSRN